MPQCDRDSPPLLGEFHTVAGIDHRFMGESIDKVLNTAALRHDVRAMQKELDLRQNTINMLMRAAEGVLQEPGMPLYRRRLLWAFKTAQRRMMKAQR